MNCSDAHVAFVCAQCGGLLSVMNLVDPKDLSRVTNDKKQRVSRKQYCIVCKSAEHVRPVYLPYVYRYVYNTLI